MHHARESYNARERKQYPLTTLKLVSVLWLLLCNFGRERKEEPTFSSRTDPL